MLTLPIAADIPGGVGTDAPVRSKQGVFEIGLQAPTTLPDESSNGKGPPPDEATVTGQLPPHDALLVVSKHASLLVDPAIWRMIFEPAAPIG
jgi:hypothetical protein